MRRTLSLSLGLWLTALGLGGCPPRETSIAVSASGVGTLLDACATPTLECDVSCLDLYDDRDAQIACVAVCNDLANVLRAQTCTVPGLKRPRALSAATPIAMRVALITVVDGNREVRADTPCQRLAFDCVGPITPDCGAKALNAALAASIPEEGLGYEGLEDADDAPPVVLFYAADDAAELDCRPTQLSACGAIGQRLPGDDDQDLVCASCYGGPRRESPPCVTDCFLGVCALIAEDIAGT